MNLTNLIAVSGLPGLFRLVTTRNNGLVVADLEKGKSQFCSVRKHQFTPLESISIYTTDDRESVELSEIFTTMRAQLADNPPVASKATSADLRTYFESILPNHDTDKVYISDIKKIIKWFNFLLERDLFVEKVEEVEEEVIEDAEIVTE